MPPKGALTGLHRLVLAESFDKIVRGTAVLGSRPHDVQDYLKTVQLDTRLLRELPLTKPQVYNAFYRQRDSVSKIKAWEENVRRCSELNRPSPLPPLDRPSPGASFASITLSAPSALLPPNPQQSVICLSCGCQCNSHIQRSAAGGGESSLHMFRHSGPGSSDSLSAASDNAGGRTAPMQASSSSGSGIPVADGSDTFDTHTAPALDSANPGSDNAAGDGFDAPADSRVSGFDGGLLPADEVLVFQGREAFPGQAARRSSATS
ncbi:MAG: hypothetical protein WDW38_007388 [Sanguina aurantia]